VEVATQLRTLRKAQDMTQAELADIVGTKKSNISRLESGRYNPSLDLMVKVAAGLGRSIRIEL
jgi:transcriptional regulator with XRE-family HTH domain